MSSGRWQDVQVLYRHSSTKMKRRVEGKTDVLPPNFKGWIDFGAKIGGRLTAQLKCATSTKTTD